MIYGRTFKFKGIKEKEEKREEENNYLSVVSIV